MDPNFHQLVLGAYNEGEKSNIAGLMQYARAEHPEWPTVPWEKAKLILIPFLLPSIGFCCSVCQKLGR